MNTSSITAPGPASAALNAQRTPAANNSQTATLRHRPHEDLQALLTGTLFVALGVLMFGSAGLLMGGTAGLALLIHYATGWNFGVVMLGVNLPFYALAWRRMGRAFTLKTVLAVALLAGFTNALPAKMDFGVRSPLLAAVLGGLLIGAGMLMLFRHRASLGGFNVLALHLQARSGWRAGHVQMGLDALIVLAAFAVVDWQHVALSVLGALVLNHTLATNHRAERYLAL